MPASYQRRPKVPDKRPDSRRERRGVTSKLRRASIHNISVWRSARIFRERQEGISFEHALGAEVSGSGRRDATLLISRR